MAGRHDWSGPSPPPSYTRCDRREWQGYDPDHVADTWNYPSRANALLFEGGGLFLPESQTGYLVGA
jgi:hypothetical protein